MSAKNIVYVGIILLFAMCAVRAQDSVPPYRNPNLPNDQRVADLLHRMTVEEKVDQIRGGHCYQILNNTGTLTPDHGAAALKQLYSAESEIPPRTRAILQNAIQRHEVEKTRLRIPAHINHWMLDGIAKRAGQAGVKVVYSEGCEITQGKHAWAEWYADNVKLADPRAQPAKVPAAVEVAKKAEVAIVVGENQGTNREAWAEDHRGDRDSLDLLGAQDELIRAIVATGTPAVVFLLNGRPPSFNYAAAHVPAILEGWYLGEEGGTAAASVLFGDVNTSGKRPVTFPRSFGQLPDYYDRKPSRNRSYEFVDNSPLFPFGFGLSYTTFNLKIFAWIHPGSLLAALKPSPWTLQTLAHGRERKSLSFTFTSVSHL